MDWIIPSFPALSTSNKLSHSHHHCDSCYGYHSQSVGGLWHCLNHIRQLQMLMDDHNLGGVHGHGDTSKWMVCSGKSHRSKWMMTGGTPMTKRKPPNVDDHHFCKPIKLPIELICVVVFGEMPHVQTDAWSPICNRNFIRRIVLTGLPVALQTASKVETCGNCCSPSWSKQFTILAAIKKKEPDPTGHQEKSFRYEHSQLSAHFGPVSCDKISLKPGAFFSWKLGSPYTTTSFTSTATAFSKVQLPALRSAAHPRSTETQKWRTQGTWWIKSPPESSSRLEKNMLGTSLCASITPFFLGINQR